MGVSLPAGRAMADAQWEGGQKGGEKYGITKKRTRTDLGTGIYGVESTEEGEKKKEPDKKKGPGTGVIPL